MHNPDRAAPVLFFAHRKAEQRPLVRDRIGVAEIDGRQTVGGETGQRARDEDGEGEHGAGEVVVDLQPGKARKSFHWKQSAHKIQITTIIIDEQTKAGQQAGV